MQHLITKSADPTKDSQIHYTLLLSLFFGGGFWLNAPISWFSNQIISPLYILQLVVLYPFFEEVIFRGAIQGELLKIKAFKKVTCRISLANLTTSILFSAMHTFNHPIEIAILTLIPSLLLGYFRERHLGIRTPIMLHMYFNGIYILSGWLTT
ncbi:JDVT-CTERM system glutamic-type intramembrane protease MrtJ [Vibrio owensii]|uniref:JDVT-CTERM system glutamic-type intramembrane protease MrtJ n=1 Tax=Vibrio owensii TaxID=696485 RepID=UPI0006AD0484